jgi:UDP-N-acetylglucosamine 4-epimerase
MKVLVTGACGFIGSNLCEELLKRGIYIVGVDDLSNGVLEFFPAGADIIVNDFVSPAVTDLIKSKFFDYVIHLAAIPRVSYSVEFPLETHETNVSKTLNLIDACRGNIKKFIFASSSSVYGGVDIENGPTKEMQQKNPKSPYALQKSIIEDYLKMYEDLYKFKSVSLRFFNVFGKNQLGNSPYATAISAWLTSIKKNESMRCDGTGEQSRDLCHVNNVVQACIKSIESEKTGIFNVAYGQRTSNIDILNFFKKRYPSSSWHHVDWRPGDVMHTHADISHAKLTLGYDPQVDPWVGIKMTADWFDENWESIKALSIRT